MSSQICTIGTLNQDLLCCIALMNALEDFPHLRTTVSTSLTNAKSSSYTSENILLLLETEQALRDADMLTAYAARFMYHIP